MVPNKWITKVYEIWSMIQLSRCPFLVTLITVRPSSGLGNIKYDYTTRISVREMCSQLSKTLPYVPDACIYDKKINDMLHMPYVSENW